MSGWGMHKPQRVRPSRDTLRQRTSCPLAPCSTARVHLLLHGDARPHNRGGRPRNTRQHETLWLLISAVSSVHSDDPWPRLLSASLVTHPAASASAAAFPGCCAPFLNGWPRLPAVWCRWECACGLPCGTKLPSASMEPPNHDLERSSSSSASEPPFLRRRLLRAAAAAAGEALARDGERRGPERLGVVRASRLREVGHARRLLHLL